jgi:hypothetical protein
MSIENGTRFVRSNLMRAPLGWTVNASPAAGAHQRVVAGAAGHGVGAAVADDAVVAAAAAQDVVGLTAEDQVRPVRANDRVHAGATVDGEQRERTHAHVRRDGVVAAEPVDLEALGRGVERERPQVRPLEPDAGVDGIEGEHVPESGSAVDLGAVVAGVTVRTVRAVALVPYQRVVSGPAVHDVIALPGDEPVVAFATGEGLVAV